MKRKPKPDTRPRWNDNLKIYYRGQYYSSEEWQEMCTRALQYSTDPNYKNDPTYNLRKKK